MRHFLPAALLISALQPAFAGGHVPAPQHLEPPFWWAGMRETQLQLLVHAPKIAGSKVVLQYPGVRLQKVQTLPNPNYLVLTLQLSPTVRPGSFDIRFLHPETRQERYQYQYRLLQREPQSAQRQGFGAQDVILNLVPDRFANGNPDNDRIAGYPDHVDRSDDGGARHGGDIAGIRSHLDYIQRMGYTMIWPTPMLENNMPRYSYHGYAATDLYRIDPRFGSNEDYRQLVQAARQRGIGMIQDVVLNHIGSHHWWMQDMPAPDWLGFQGKFVPTRHARTTLSDRYAAAADRENFSYGWFTDTMPDLNQRNPVLATYQIQNTIWWIEYAGLSGLRVDTYSYSDPAFLARWSARILREYPHFSMVGEEWSTQPLVVARWLRGYRNPDGYRSSMPSMMDFPMQDVLRQAFSGNESWNSGFNSLYEALVADQLYPQPERMVLFDGNHDISRIYSVFDKDAALVKMALAYIATIPRTPQLYYGTEILMESRKERDDGAARRDFPGGWAEDKVNAFTGAGLSDAQQDMQRYVARLLNWRKTATAVHKGRMLHFSPEDGIYCYFRILGKQTVMVVLNKNTESRELALARFAEGTGQRTQATDVIAGRQFRLGEKLSVPARSATILELE